MHRNTIWQGQGKTLLVTLAALVLLVGYMVWRGVSQGVETPRTMWVWSLVAIAVPILHQQWVWLFWRLELSSSWFTRHWGFRLGFGVYAVGFMFMFAGRLVALIPVGIASKGSLGLPVWLTCGAAALITVPVAYLAWSVGRYFTISRALGIDHFDKTYNVPFERRGIFRYTNNGMYIYGFLFLYYPGLLYASEQALLIALFNHLYIWTHYFFTERPDMEVIYGGTPER